MCKALWSKMISGSAEEVSFASAELKGWVSGYNKLKKPEGWVGRKVYLATEQQRVLLFPGAEQDVTMEGTLGSNPSPWDPPRPSADTAGAEEEEEAMDEDEDTSGLPPSDPQEAPVPRPSGSGAMAALANIPAALPAGDNDSALQGIFDMVNAVRQAMLEMSAQQNRTPQPSPATTARLPSTSSLPSEEAHNPWRPCTPMFMKDDHIWFSQDSCYAFDRVEFYPDRQNFPNCYVRFKAGSFASLKVPQETVLYPLGEATAVLAKLATAVGCKQADVGAMGSSDPVFILNDTCVPPFFGKVLKAVLKSFDGSDKDAFKNLKEIKQFGLLIPSASDSFPEMTGIASIFEEGRLKANSPSVQLKEPFPDLTKALIESEFLARQRFGKALTLHLTCETSQMLHKDFSLAPLQSKLSSQFVGEALEAWIKAKRACRQHVVDKAAVLQEPKSLVESSPFCASLFPIEKVEEVLRNALRDGKTLFNRWAVSSTSTANTSSFFGKRKKGKQGRGNPAQRARGAAPSHVQSPATVPHREEANQPSRRGRGRGRGERGRGGAGRGRGSRGASSGTTQ